MTSEQPPPSKYPPSMGPGARPSQPGQNSGNRARQIVRESAREAAAIRAQYKYSWDETGIDIHYPLKGVEQTHKIAFDAMPVSGFFRWLYFGGPLASQRSCIAITDFLRDMENISNTMMTQREAEGFARHALKSRGSFYATFSSCAIGGAAMTAYGWNDMKFPFVNVRPAEKYQNFPNRYLPILTGSFARASWQLTRFTVWFTACGLLALPVFSSMSTSAAWLGLHRDERTKDFMMRLKNMRWERQAAGQQRSPPPLPAQTASGDGNPQDFYGSPSSPASVDRAFTDNADTSMMGDSGMGQSQPREASASSWSRIEPWRQQPHYEKPSQPVSSQDSDFFFDGDSPSNDPNSPTYQSSSQTQSMGGSAWARIRQGSRSVTPRPASTGTNTNDSSPNFSQRRSRAPESESRSFSHGDEDRDLARQQAQREFDVMLERERKESGSGELERSMNAVQQGQEGSGNEGIGGSAWERRRG